MGNDIQSSSASDQSDFIREFKSKYDFQTEGNDKRFGDLCIYKHKTERKFIAKRGHMCKSSEDYAAYIRSCRQRQNLKNKNILMLYYFQEANEDNICGDFNKITIYFEYYMHDLEKELNRRRDNGQEFFSESELWYLLDSLIQASSYLEKNKIYHGDIRPFNILLTPEGQVKIADHGILHIDQSSYYKMLYQGEKCYLSPSLLRSLSVGEYKPFHDVWKSDVFSLGMTLLETASLCQPMCAYDFEKFNISYPILEELLNHCRTRYSDFFVNLICDMLLEDENLRPSFDSIRNVLIPFQNSIQTNQQLQRNTVVYQNPIVQPVQLQHSQVQVQPAYMSQFMPQPQTSTPFQNNIMNYLQQPSNSVQSQGGNQLNGLQGQETPLQQVPLTQSQISGLQQQTLQQTIPNVNAQFNQSQIIQHPRIAIQQPYGNSVSQQFTQQFSVPQQQQVQQAQISYHNQGQVQHLPQQQQNIQQMQGSQLYYQQGQQVSQLPQPNLIQQQLQQQQQHQPQQQLHPQQLQQQTQQQQQQQQHQLQQQQQQQPSLQQQQQQPQLQQQQPSLQQQQQQPSLQQQQQQPPQQQQQLPQQQIQQQQQQPFVQVQQQLSNSQVRFDASILDGQNIVNAEQNIHKKVNDALLETQQTLLRHKEVLSSINNPIPQQQSNVSIQKNQFVNPPQVSQVIPQQSYTESQKNNQFDGISVYSPIYSPGNGYYPNVPFLQQSRQHVNNA